MFIRHLFSAVGLLATLIFAAYPCGLLTEDQMLEAYAPFAWLCLHVPGFVEYHEQWIDVVAMVRTAYLAIELLESV